MELRSSDRLLAGWRLRSAVPLPELLPWIGDERPPDIEIAVAPLPSRLDDIRSGNEEGDVDGDGKLQFEAPGIGRFRVEGEARVIVDPSTDITSPALRLQLYGPVFGALCNRHGILPMHGSCVVIDGAAHLFIGNKGAGKSSIAAALVQRGHGLMTDDLCPISVTDPAHPVVLPGVPRLRLLADAALHLGFGMAPAEGIAAKMAFPLADRACPHPLPLAAIHHVAEGEGRAGPRLEQMSKIAGLAGLQQQVYRWRQVMVLGTAPRIFRGVAALAESVPNDRLCRGTLATIEAAARLMEGSASRP